MPISPVILITGASSGIGEAAAHLFGSEGYRVVLAARRKERIQALALDIQSEGGEALAVPTDITQLDQIENLVSRSLEHFGQIDLLLNNAGLGRITWLQKLNPQEDIDFQIRVNLTGLIQITRAVLPHMIEHNKGHIINIGSIAGLIATPTYSVYAATKYGLRGFTEALRREVGVHGIEVTGIYPGGVATEFGHKAGIKRKTGISTPKCLKLTAEDVAGSILRVAKRPRRSVIIPGLMRPMVWISVMFPGLLDWVIERRFTRREL
jgi:NADP-dependent 3-hydroxy acid dehydrogenase YdfG